MKQSTSKSTGKRRRQSSNALFAMATEEELEVCEALLDLINVRPPLRPPERWFVYRKRSKLAAAAQRPAADVGVAAADVGVAAADVGVAAADVGGAAADVGGAASTSPTTSPSQSLNMIFKNKGTPNAEKATASSPDTPLSFAPSSESEEKPKHTSKKNSKKRTKDDMIGTIQGLTQDKEALSRNVENVKNYRNDLKAYNDLLNALRRKTLADKQRKEEAQKQLNQINNSTHYPIPITHMFLGFAAANVTAPPLLITSPTNNGGSGSGRVNHVGPRGIPDLNVSAEEAFGSELLQPYDYAMNREISKEKRRIRRIIRTQKRSEQRSSRV